MIKAVRILQQVRKGAFSIVCTRGQSLQKERFCPTAHHTVINKKQKIHLLHSFVLFIWYGQNCNLGAATYNHAQAQSVSIKMLIYNTCPHEEN